MALRNRASLFCVLVMAVWAGESLPQTSYPTRAVRMVVPSSAGGGTDTGASRLGQPGQSTLSPICDTSFPVAS